MIVPNAAHGLELEIHEVITVRAHFEVCPIKYFNFKYTRKISKKLEKIIEKIVEINSINFEKTGKTC